MAPSKVDKNIKVLFITRNFENRMEKSSLYLAQELSKHCALQFWYRDGDIRNILNNISFTPDFILLNDYKYDYCPFVTGLSDINIPVGAIMHDLKYKVKRRSQFYETEKIHHIFTHYRDASLEWLPEHKDHFRWLPHHVPINIYKDYKLPKSINFLMMGIMIPKLYPERTKMYQIMKDEPGFIFHNHPGYKDIDPNALNLLVGENYAREINRAKMFITCDSADHFPLMKYFEVLACNTLLLATPSQELEDLGFIDGETFIAVDSTNVKEKAYYYLKHEEERNAIAQRGYEMVRQRHSTEIRTKELLGNIFEIIVRGIKQL